MRKIVRSLMAALGIVGALMCSGCATPYKAHGIAGGYGSITGFGKLDRVYFGGNGYTDLSTAKKYALYRAAEISRKNNKPYFLIYETLNDAARNNFAREPAGFLLKNFPAAEAFVVGVDQPQPGSLSTEAVLAELNALKSK